MYFQIFAVLSALQLSAAISPVIYQKDNSVIATEPMKVSLPQEQKFIPVHYAYYEVIPNQATDPEILPADLIEIARTRLGVRNLDEIPSVSALGELLGTTSPEETIETIRQLTATESGIDLIKAFMESADYTDNTAIEEPEPSEADTSGPSLPTSLLSETVQKDLEIAQKVLTTPKPEVGFFQRLSSFFSLFDLFPSNKEIPVAPVNKKVEQLDVDDQKKDNELYNRGLDQVQSTPITNDTPNSFAVPIPSSNVLAYPPVRTYRPYPIIRGPYVPQV